jgi:hypothetical protein
MRFSVVFKSVQHAGYPAGYYHAHVPSLALTTHGPGMEGAREAAAAPLRLWLLEKRASGEAVAAPSETLFGTLQIPENALQSA